MARPGPKNDITDIAGLRVGQVEDEAVNTGVTVVVCDAPAIASVDVAGGGPGTRETDALASGRLVERVDAVCLSGGSAFGLAAADGVSAELCKDGRGFALMEMEGVPPTPIVPAAILYDLANGGDKSWSNAPPYAGLGAAAYRMAGEEPLRQGRAGAGYGAQAGAHPGGTGSASIVTEDGITVAALACVNCFGSVYMPGSEAFWAWPYEIDGEFGGQRPAPEYRMEPGEWGAAKLDGRPLGNTTIAVVATDARLTKDQAQRLAVMAQDGLARAIRPVHAPFDGDVVFALSTERRDLPEPSAYTLTRLGNLAADCLTRSIARAVHQARP